MIRKMGFIHMLMSQHTNHILFLIKEKFNQYLASRPILKIQPVLDVSCSRFLSSTYYLLRKIVTLKFVSAKSLSLISQACGPIFL